MPLLDRLPPAAAIYELYRIVRTVDRIDLPTLRIYVEVMRERAISSRPAEHFVQQRLEGLERLASTLAQVKQRIRASAAYSASW